MDPETTALGMSQLLAELAARKRALRRAAEELESAGRVAEAAEQLEDLVGLDPRDPDSWRAMGLLLLRTGRYAEALERLREARRIDPGNAVRYYDLGSALPKAGLSGAPLEEQLGAGAPASAPADRSLEPGHILMMTHDLAGAAEAYRNALKRAPHDPQCWMNLGTALEKQERSAEARHCFGEASRLRGRFAEAADHFEHSLRLQAGRGETCAALADCQRMLLRFDEEVRVCREGLRHQPDMPELHLQLGQALADSGRTEEALAVAAAAASRFPGDVSFRVQEKLVFPRVCDTEEEAARWASDYARGLSRLEGEIPAEDAAAALRGVRSAPRPYAQYQEGDLREMRRFEGGLIHRLMAACYPQWAGPLSRRPANGSRRIRVGYASSHLGNAAGSWWLLGWLAGHDHAEFEICGYHLGGASDPFTWEFRRRCDLFRRLPGGLEAACERIAADRLDVLVWTDFASAPQTMMMAGLRLAPVQCVGWGYPYTSGLPTVDYCLSGDLMEPAEAESHYTEKLVRLPGIGATYPRPVVPARTRPRADFGFREDAIVYVSFQTASKYHPRYDRLFPEIARRVPRAQFAFLAQADEAVGARFRERLRRSFAEAGLAWEDHCIFVPLIRDWEDYVMRYRAADVFLDTFVWSGCVTTLEAVACGLPVVTCPGRFRRSRQSAAILRQLGVTETVARSEAEYADIAARLGQDARWRREIGRRFVEHHSRLYGDPAPLRAVEEFYRRVAGG